MRSIAIPGGRRALRSARPVNLYIAEDCYDVKLRVPNVAGAIMVKAAAAIDERTSDGQRHLDDVAFLLGLPFDLRTVANDLEPGDSDLLNQLRPRLTNPTNPVWETVPRRTPRPRPHLLRNTHPTITLTAGADHTAALGTTHRDLLLRALIDTLLTR